MKLKTLILNDLKNARIAHCKLEIFALSTLIGELDRVSKNPDDDLVLKVIKLAIKDNCLCGNLDENRFLAKYLPAVFSESELQIIIDKIINDNNFADDGIRVMGKVMNLLDSNYKNKYDGRMASNLVKKTLING
jgi:Glu-tRNA(Gln) amidotransferase subunit E-like FAD-binding protein